MANRSLGTQQNDSGDGLDAHTHRMILRALYPSNGILDGLQVSYAGGTYNVSAGDAVVGDDTDGARIAHWDGGSVDGTASGSTDSVYIKANDPVQSGDGSVDVVCGVTSGSGIPEGATLLAEMNGSTAMSVGGAAVPYGGSAGVLAYPWWQNDYTFGRVLGARGQQIEGVSDITLPGPRLLEFQYVCSYSAQDAKNPSEYCINFTLDGQPISHASAHFASSGTWETHQFDFITHVSGGSHTVGVMTWWQSGSRPVFHYSPRADEKQGYVGRRMWVFDRGPANGQTQIGR